LDKLLSVSEVAALRGVTRVCVLYAIRDGRLPGTRVGSMWVVREVDAEGWSPRAYSRSVRNASGHVARVKRLA